MMASPDPPMASHRVFTALLSSVRLLDLSLLPRLGPLVREAEALWRQNPRTGLVTLPLPGSGAAPLLVRVSCDALSRSSTLVKLDWHAGSDDKPKRFEFIDAMQRTLWLEVAAVMARDVGIAPSLLVQPVAGPLYDAMRAYCLTLERGIYYGARSAADYVDSTTAEGRFVLMHVLAWEGGAAIRSGTAGGGAGGAVPPPPPPSNTIRETLRMALETTSSFNGREDGSTSGLVPLMEHLQVLLHSRFCLHVFDPRFKDKPCPVFGSDCAAHGELWASQHLKDCQLEQCPRPLCTPARATLKHFRECNSTACATCISARAYQVAERQRSIALGGGVNLGLKRSHEQMGAGGGASGGGAPGGRNEPKRSRCEGGGSLGDAAAAGGGGGSRLDGYSNLLATFPMDGIQRHMLLMRDDFNAGMEPPAIRSTVSKVLETLQTKEFAWIFNSQVDPVKLNLPDYFDIVKRPMDLGTIKKRLDGDYYRSFRSFADDVRQVWNNALSYNAPGSEVHRIASHFSSYFERAYGRIEQTWVNHHEKSRITSVDLCSICAGSRMMFEPVTLYCNACTKRLHKGVTFFTNKSKKYHWCTTCFAALPKGVEVLIDDQFLPYKELEKRKNDSEEDERWVQCDHCLRWQHQICALYNSRRNEGVSLPHYCGHCIMLHMQAKQMTSPILKPIKRAKDLQQCRLSDLIEERLAAMLELQRQSLATDQRVSKEDVVMPEFTVRVTACIDKTFLVGPEFNARYGPLGFLPQQNYRSKAVVLFQNLCGVDTLLFAVYWQEYADECGEPNKRCAYLSYLDSVKYLEPSFLRTEVYHEILAAYISDLKDRGFNQVNLWSCPPQKGDDYILSCHPEEQKTPRAEMLREWYIALLDECQRRGSVERVAFLADDMFPSVCGAEGGADRPISCLPYFEGDYCASQLEVEIKRLRDAGHLTPYGVPGPSSRAAAVAAAGGGEGGDSDAEGGSDGDAAAVSLGKASKSSKSGGGGSKKSKSASQRVRPGGVSNGMRSKTGGGVGPSNVAAGVGGVSVGTLRRRGPVYGPSGTLLPDDELRFALAERLVPMRQDFLVAKLRPSCQVCKRFITGAPGLDVRYHCIACEEQPAPPLAPSARRPTARPFSGSARRVNICYDLCASCFERERAAEEQGIAPGCGVRTLVEHGPAGTHTLRDLVAMPVPLAPGLRSAVAGNAGAAASSSRAMVVAAAAAMGSDALPTGLPIVPVVSAGAGAGAGAIASAPIDVALVGDGVIVDPDPLIDSPFWKSRASFLHLCQGNHYQFDQLRRARHSSMQVLYHMHHPFAPSFVHSCNNCGISIAHLKCDESCERIAAEQAASGIVPVGLSALTSVSAAGTGAGAGAGVVDGGGVRPPMCTRGVRWSCTVCEEFDLCDKCARDSAAGRIGTHEHPLLSYSNAGMGDEAYQVKLAEAETRRKREVAVAQSALIHVSTCPAPCGADSCSNATRELLAHVHPSTLSKRTCEPCRSLDGLILVHARSCRLVGRACPVVRCGEFKEKLRALSVAGTGMDARRRAKANQLVVDGGVAAAAAAAAGGGKGADPMAAAAAAASSGEGGAGEGGGLRQSLIAAKSGSRGDTKVGGGEGGGGEHCGDMDPATKVKYDKLCAEEPRFLAFLGRLKERPSEYAIYEEVHAQHTAAAVTKSRIAQGPSALRDPVLTHHQTLHVLMTACVETQKRINSLRQAARLSATPAVNLAAAAAAAAGTTPMPEVPLGVAPPVSVAGDALDVSTDAPAIANGRISTTSMQESSG